MEKFNVALHRDVWDIVKRVLEFDALNVDFDDEDDEYTNALWDAVEAIKEARCRHIMEEES